MKFKQEIATDGEWTDWITELSFGVKIRVVTKAKSG